MAGRAIVHEPITRPSSKRGRAAVANRDCYGHFRGDELPGGDTSGGDSAHAGENAGTRPKAQSEEEVIRRDRAPDCPLSFFISFPPPPPLHPARTSRERADVSTSVEGRILSSSRG